MNVIAFGATGMVGQGVQRECLLEPRRPPCHDSRPNHDRHGAPKQILESPDIAAIAPMS